MMISKTKPYIWLGILAAILVFGFFKFARRSIEVSNTGEKPAGLLQFFGSGKKENTEKSPLTGERCATAASRPFAVMVSSDKEARPLSGIGEADWVFEMPVVENGFTRMMAVYQCGRPKEIGSVRSSRLDFVPLALGINAVYAHFGGEHEALEQLRNGVIDNIDGLRYDGTYYYRKSSIPRPHNAFTDFDLLAKISGELGYDLTDAKVIYPHESNSKSQGEIQPAPIFNEKFQVVWRYDKTANSYRRARSGQPEIDKNTGQPVSAGNVVIMKTTWSPINQDYIRVKTVGSGGLLLYKNGTVVTGTWEKKDNNAKLYFYDQNHKEIELVAGKVWVEIDAY